MTDIAALKRANAARWAQMKLHPDRVPALNAVAHRLCAPAAKAQYQAISKATGVPWFVIAVIHEREASQRFDCQLGQGDPLAHVSTHDPRGRGPFKSFYDGALDALIHCGPYASRWGDWSVGGTLTLLEEYNGLGYASRGVPSAYVWSGSDQYVSGKYVADHEYRASAVDVQEGCASLIKCMMGVDRSISFGAPGAGAVVAGAGAATGLALHHFSFVSPETLVVCAALAAVALIVWLARK
jgi:lysozyme family protein